MRWFEQAISKNKVSSNAISPPCEAKAQTVVVPVTSGAVCRKGITHTMVWLWCGFFVALYMKDYYKER